MVSDDPFTAWVGPGGEADCCAYLIENGHRERCGDPCAVGSSYCPLHHALTHVARGTQAEARHFQRINRIAKIVSRRLGSGGIAPLPGEIEEIERRQLFAILGPRRLGRAGRPPKLRT